MGCADVIPGVSGGTIALVLGIYTRLVSAISRFDRKLVGYLFKGELKSALAHIDFYFLASLLAGIMGGIVVMTLTLGRLLHDEFWRPFVLALFFGAVVGSAIIVLQLIARNSPERRVHFFPLVLGAAIAIVVSFTSRATIGEPAIWQVFVAGAISICAMILPGISGALVLQLIGLYDYMIDTGKAAISGEQIVHNLTVIAAFGLGAATGLLSFAKILRNLLSRRYGGTMSLMCGLMVGSLAVLWPFQRKIVTDSHDAHSEFYRPIWPENLQTETIAVLLTAILSAAAVLTIDYVSHRLSNRD